MKIVEDNKEDKKKKMIKTKYEANRRVLGVKSVHI